MFNGVRQIKRFVMNRREAQITAAQLPRGTGLVVMFDSHLVDAVFI